MAWELAINAPSLSGQQSPSLSCVETLFSTLVAMAPVRPRKSPSIADYWSMQLLAAFAVAAYLKCRFLLLVAALLFHYI